MLSKEDNELLCRVGPGTPMGNLLRRYWLPALLCEELPEPDCPPVRVRLLCEDLIAFRTTSGDVGLVAQACPHRGASLFFGRNEEGGLRCVYHGWKFDVSGACVDMPSEPAESNFRSKVHATAYPTHESGGIVWTYMGPPEKRPGFRDFGSESLPREQWRSSKTLSECNWVQGLEGNIDTTHISFLHGGRPRLDNGPFADDGTDREGYPSQATRGYIHRSVGGAYLDVEDTWYGFRYAGIRPTPNGLLNVRVSDFIMPFFTYVPQPYLPVGGDSMIMMVPIDDSHFWRWSVEMKPGIRQRQAARPGAEMPAFGPGTGNPGGGMSREGPAPSRANDYLIDREAQRERSFTGIQGIGTQDMAVTESMGDIYERTHEHLGTSDRAIIRMRRLLIDTARKLAQGIEPPALDASLPFRKIRSAERNIRSDEDWRILGTDQDAMVDEELKAVIAV